MRRTLLLACLILAGAASAVHAESRWLQARTAHFRFVYRQSEQWAADELAGMCEEVYGRVTAFFGSYPREIPCVIHGSIDAANGAAAPFPGHIELVATAPTDNAMGARTESWLRLALTHELTHHVHMSMDRGPFAALARVFGEDLKWGTLVFLPGWMVEGPTTNLETLFTRGGRGRDPLFQMLWKAPLLEGDLFSLRQAGYTSSFPPVGRIYVAGYILVDHLLDRYGPDAFTRIMDSYLAFPFFGPWAAIEKVTGKKASAVYTDMKAALAASFPASSRTRGGERIAPPGIGDIQAPRATAGGLYAYSRAPNRQPALVALDPATGGEEVLARVTLTDASSFCATADGMTLYFASLEWDWRLPGAGEAVSDLYSLDRRTGRMARLTRGAHLWQPAVSPDGARLVAVQGEGPSSRLVRVDTASGAVAELYSLEGARVFTPSFSPDGTRLLFALNVRGIQDICMLSLDGTGGPAADFLTGPDPAGEYYPAFLPDGRIVFASDRTGSLCLYALTPPGGLEVIVEDPVAAISAVVDGSSLLYASYSPEGFCLKRIGLADLDSVTVPAPRTAEELPPPGAAPPPVQSGPYVDLPLPYAWYPWVPLELEPGGSLDAGIGARAHGGSLLGVSSWSLGTAWHPLTSQPSLQLAASTALGKLRIDSAFSSDYDEGGSFRQDITADLGLWYPLAWGHSLATGFSFVARTRLSFDTSLELPAGFTFADSLAAEAGAWRPSLRVTPGLALHLQRQGAALDFFPPWDLAAALDASFLLPVFPATGPARWLGLFLSASVPSPIPHQVLKLGLKASWTLGAAGLFVDPSVAPRGSFALEPRSGPGLLLAGVDYLAPIALLDLPLVLGLGLTGIGVGVHAEWGGEISAPAAFVPDTSVYVGAEITLQLTAGIQRFPAGAGLAFRLDAARPFDPAADIRPYIFLSFDSFRDAAGERAAPRPPSVPPAPAGAFPLRAPP